MSSNKLKCDYCKKEKLAKQLYNDYVFNCTQCPVNKPHYHFLCKSCVVTPSNFPSLVKSNKQ